MFGLMWKKTHKRIIGELKQGYETELSQANILPKEIKDSCLTLPANMKEKYRNHSNAD